MIRLLRLLSIVSCLAFLLAQVASAGARIALVIGNSGYVNAPSLVNPANDANDLGDVFERLGFDVERKTDLTQIELLGALKDFQRRTINADVAIIYYAGHGIEIDRQNFLIPIDASLKTDRDIAFEGVTLETALLAVEGANKLSLVIVDACRNNPFAATIKHTSASRSIGRGLALVEPASNTLVAYAAKEGTQAADGEGRNSPYATALIQSLEEPGVEIGKVFRRVRDRVLTATNGAQEPFLYGSLSSEDIFLHAAPSQPATAVEEPKIALTTPQPDSNALELAFWNAISESNDPRDFEDYLARFAGGSFAGLARRRLEDLSTRENEPRALALQQSGTETVVNPRREFIANRGQIERLQKRLNFLGFNAGTADGLAGNRTATAISAYQQSAGQPVTGEITADLISELAVKVPDEKIASSISVATNAPASKPVTTVRPPKVNSTASPTQTVAIAPKASTGSMPGNIAGTYCRGPNRVEQQTCYIVAKAGGNKISVTRTLSYPNRAENRNGPHIGTYIGDNNFTYSAHGFNKLHISGGKFTGYGESGAFAPYYTRFKKIR